ncbi:MAG: PDZ domain-containing protein, partial [bacterium]
GDVVLAFNGRPLDDMRELQRKVADAPVGKQVTLKIWRNGAARIVRVTIGDMGKYNSSDGNQAAAEPASSPRLGIEVRPLSAEEARQNGQSGVTGGVVVTEVEQGSPAEGAGVQVGDIILEFGVHKVTDPSQLAGLAQGLKPGQSAVLRVFRDGRSLYLDVQPGDNSGGGGNGNADGSGNGNAGGDDR